jgi:hypothetical protein
MASSRFLQGRLGGICACCVCVLCVGFEREEMRGWFFYPYHKDMKGKGNCRRLFCLLVENERRYMRRRGSCEEDIIIFSNTQRVQQQSRARQRQGPRNHSISGEPV